MTWEVVKTTTNRGLVMGQFAVRLSPNFHLPMRTWEGKNYTWYLDRKAKVAKMQLEANGLKKSKTTVTIPKPVATELSIENSYIVYLDETALYLCRYKDGQEHLQKFLKLNK